MMKMNNVCKQISDNTKKTLISIGYTIKIVPNANHVFAFFSNSDTNTFYNNFMGKMYIKENP